MTVTSLHGTNRHYSIFGFVHTSAALSADVVHLGPAIDSLTSLDLPHWTIHIDAHHIDRLITLTSQT